MVAIRDSRPPCLMTRFLWLELECKSTTLSCENADPTSAVVRSWSLRYERSLGYHELIWLGYNGVWISICRSYSLILLMRTLSIPTRKIRCWYVRFLMVFVAWQSLWSRLGRTFYGLVAFSISWFWAGLTSSRAVTMSLDLREASKATSDKLMAFVMVFGARIPTKTPIIIHDLETKPAAGSSCACASFSCTADGSWDSSPCSSVHVGWRPDERVP